MLHHSMVELPNEPMRPRRYDDRVGFFRVTFEDYGSPKQEVEQVQLHQPLAAREEGPEGRGLRAQEADRLLYRPRGSGQMAALDQEGNRGLAAGLREGGLQEGHPRQGAPHRARGPRLGRRGRPLFLDPLAPLHHRERLRTARSRPAHRRDPRSRHPHVSQCDEADSRLVLRPGIAQRPEGPDAAPARRPDGRDCWRTSRRTRSATRWASGTT